MASLFLAINYILIIGRYGLKGEQYELLETICNFYGRWFYSDV